MNKDKIKAKAKEILDKDSVKKISKDLEPSIKDVKSFIKKPSINNMFKLSDKSLITLIAALVLIVVIPISLIGVVTRNVSNNSYCKDLRAKSVKINSVSIDNPILIVEGYVPNTKIPKVYLDDKEVNLNITVEDYGDNYIADYLAWGVPSDSKGICRDMNIGVYRLYLNIDISDFINVEILTIQGNDYQIIYNLKTKEQDVKFGKPKKISSTDDSNNDDKNKDNQKDTSNEKALKELDITSSTVTSLVYPKVNNPEGFTSSSYWEYKDIDMTTLSRDAKMFDALRDTKSNGYADDMMTVYFSSNELKNNFKKTFGPDAEYKDDDFKAGGCGDETKFNSTYYRYENSEGCGGVLSYYWDNMTKLYKAEQNGDEIYTYFYVQPYIIDDFNKEYYLFKRENSKDYSSSDYNSVNITGYDKKVSTKSAIESTITSADTYKFTFKKQSDGKYYFVSGRWQ